MLILNLGHSLKHDMTALPQAVAMMKQETSTDTARAFKKDSDDEARIYDTDGYWLRAACVCVKVI